MPKRPPDYDAPAFGKRLCELLADSGVPRRGAGAYLQRKYKVSNVTANDWLNGKFRPEIPTAKQIANDHGSTFDHLYFGDGGSRNGHALVASHETRTGYVRFQDMGQGGAGPGVINPDYPEVFREVEIAEWQLRQELGRIPSPQRVKLLTVRGNSMAPRIRHGDVVFVDVEDCRPEDGCLFAVLLQGATLVKLLEFRRDGVHIVSLAAPERPDIVPPNEMESLRIAGRVLGAIQLRKTEDL